VKVVGLVVGSVDEPLRDLREQLAHLKRENAQLRDVLSQVPVALLIKDRESRFLYANPVGAAGYGIPAEQLVGRLERDVMPPGNAVDEYLVSDRHVIDTGQPHQEPEGVFRSADGTSYVLTVQKFPVDFAGQKAVLIVAFDLTRVSELMQERAALERKVLETQRLESLGVMAGGIAHDFNNLLVGVLANADLALADASVGPDAARYIGRLKGAAQRLATLSRQMLAYSGRARFSSELLNLGDETTELLELITASIPKHVRVQTDLPADLPRVPVDATQMRQVILRRGSARDETRPSN
jgi:PAS domain S-box-containing protein